MGSSLSRVSWIVPNYLRPQSMPEPDSQFSSDDAVDDHAPKNAVPTSSSHFAFLRRAQSTLVTVSLVKQHVLPRRQKQTTTQKSKDLHHHHHHDLFHGGEGDDDGGGGGVEMSSVSRAVRVRSSGNRLHGWPDDSTEGPTEEEDEEEFPLQADVDLALLEAVRDVDVAIELCPHYPLAYYLKGKLLMAFGMWKEAIEAFSSGITIVVESEEGEGERDEIETEEAVARGDPLLSSNQHSPQHYLCYVMFALQAECLEELDEYEQAVALRAQIPRPLRAPVLQQQQQESLKSMSRKKGSFSISTSSAAADGTHRIPNPLDESIVSAGAIPPPPPPPLHAGGEGVLARLQQRLKEYEAADSREKVASSSLLAPVDANAAQTADVLRQSDEYFKQRSTDVYRAIERDYNMRRFQFGKRKIYELRPYQREDIRQRTVKRDRLNAVANAIDGNNGTYRVL